MCCAILAVVADFVLFLQWPDVQQLASEFHWQLAGCMPWTVDHTISDADQVHCADITIAAAGGGGMRLLVLLLLLLLL